MNYFLFDGASSALDCGSQTLAGDLTVAFRMNPVAWGGLTYCPFSAGNRAASPSDFFDVLLFGGAVGTEIFTDGSGGAAGPYAGGGYTSVFPLATDAFVVITRSGTPSSPLWSAYVNGVLQATRGAGFAAQHLTEIRLGCECDFGTNDNWSNVQISQFGIWSVAWSGPDIASHAAGNDPTSIEWGSIVQYQPLQVNKEDILGEATSSIGTPGFVGTPSTISLSPTSVAPSSVTTITVTGTDTPWISGSAPFVPSAGSVSSDSVSTSTSRTFSFAAPASGTVTFTDPSTGATAALTLTSTATKLLVTTQPPLGAIVGSQFGLVVSAVNSGGTVDTTFTGNVTVAINPNDVMLNGTTAVAAVAGVATFSGLSISKAVQGHTLTATATLLTDATTNWITAIPGDGIAQYNVSIPVKITNSGDTLVVPAIPHHSFCVSGWMLSRGDTNSGATNLMLKSSGGRPLVGPLCVLSQGQGNAAKGGKNRLPVCFSDPGEGVVLSIDVDCAIGGGLVGWYQ